MDISWKTIQSSLLNMCAFSIVELSISIGSFVLLPGRAAQLCSERMFLSLSTCVSLWVIIVVNIFFGASSRVIGLILDRSLFQSCIFGMG